MIPKDILASEIRELHPAGASDRLGRFIDAMKTYGGWGSFSPLVVVEESAKYGALTGAHRFTAAKTLGIIRIPCYVISAEVWLKSGLKYAELRTLPDEERCKRLTRAGLKEFADQILAQNAQLTPHSPSATAAGPRAGNEDTRCG